MTRNLIKTSRITQLVRSAFVIVFLLSVPSSCCSFLDCIEDSDQGYFRIVSGSNGSDLVFGPSRVYDKDKIKFYSLKGTDTTFLNYEAARSPETGYDSILSVYFFTKPDTAFIRLSNGDIDTLTISYRSYQSTCCGTITDITKFRFNNIDLPDNILIRELKK